MIYFFINSDYMVNTIFISGTPCTGKTTVSEALFNRLNNEDHYDVKLVKANDLAFDNDLILGDDPDKAYKVVDLKGLDSKFDEVQREFLSSEGEKPKLLIFEGHLTHFCSNPDKVIILRVHPDKLKERLAERNYSPSKIHENLGAECLGVCSVESYERHGSKAHEIDVTDMSVDEILDIIVRIINGERIYPVGVVDYLGWFVKDEEGSD